MTERMDNPERPLGPRATAAADLVRVVARDEPEQAVLERLSEQAAAAVPGTRAQISLISDRHVVLTGTAAGLEVALDESLCAATLTVDRPLVIPDATTDARVSSMDAVSAGAVKAYLGIPLRVPGGGAVGVLCVYADQPREWAPADVDRLRAVAASVSTELAALRPA